MTTTELKKTPFYARNLAAGAKMVEFAGYTMPVQYTSIVGEHKAVRSAVGMFDLSHMGEFIVSGTGAFDFLQRMTTNDVAALTDYKVQYSILCYEHGGIVDDLLVYKLPDRYYLVVNGSNVEKDLAWLNDHKPDNVQLENISEQTGLLAIQGPDAQKVMAKLTDVDLDAIGFYRSAEAEVCGRKILFSRTGYTGEDGFELYLDAADAEHFWDAVRAAGEEFGLVPVGLGARDSLRLEMKYCLYGNDIDQTTNPIEAGLSWVVKPDKGDFIGKGPIMQTKADKPTRRLVCFEMIDRAIPRHGYDVVNDGEKVGSVASGIHSPSLAKGIGTAYVRRGLTKVGTELAVDIRGRACACRIVKPPFYKEGSRR